MVRDTNDTEVYGDQAANSPEASTAVVLEAVTETVLTTPTDSKRSRNALPYNFETRSVTLTSVVPFITSNTYIFFQFNFYFTKSSASRLFTFLKHSFALAATQKILTDHLFPQKAWENVCMNYCLFQKSRILK